MNLYNYIFNVWEHLIKLEMNLISMQYPEAFLKHVSNIFHYSTKLNKGFQMP